ncbi:MAG: hypothetical protein K8H88_30385, partial [Sandaracinaceae bacterium]|nr:hypothetical protein [Sandaracinaceae bacterium]
MTVSSVRIACPTCQLEYRVAIDLSVLARLKKRANCARCQSSFDVVQNIVRQRTSHPPQGVTQQWYAPATPSGRRPSERTTAPPPLPSEPPEQAASPDDREISLAPYLSEPPLGIDLEDLEDYEPVRYRGSSPPPGQEAAPVQWVPPAGTPADALDLDLDFFLPPKAGDARNAPIEAPRGVAQGPGKPPEASHPLLYLSDLPPADAKPIE